MISSMCQAAELTHHPGLTVEASGFGTHHVRSPCVRTISTALDSRFRSDVNMADTSANDDNTSAVSDSLSGTAPGCSDVLSGFCAVRGSALGTAEGRQDTTGGAELGTSAEVRGAASWRPHTSHSVGMPEVAEAVPDREALCRSQGQRLIWVAEVSVAPAFARQGIGHQLIAHVEDWGRSNNRRATTLTTFRDVPWKGPLRNAGVPRALRLRNRQRSFGGNEARSVTAWSRCLASLCHDQAQRWRFQKAPWRGTLDHAAGGALRRR
jgi:GNAT superfamily N-acetyltransferase